MAKVTSVLVLAVVAITVGLVSALTDEEKRNVRADLAPVIESCGKEFSITIQDVIAAKEAKNPDALNSCFLACVLQKIGTLNDQGLYEPAVAKAVHKKYVHGQDELTKLDAIADICSSVNDQTVSDGVKGCERAKLIIRCLAENNASISPIAI